MGSRSFRKAPTHKLIFIASSLDTACGIDGFKALIFLDIVMLHRGYRLFGLFNFYQFLPLTGEMANAGDKIIAVF